MADYPQEPWHLVGQLHTSVYLVPTADLDAVLPDGAPPGFRPVRLGRRVVVGVAWVSYESGGVLTYRELMATALVRRGLRMWPTVTHIWVDSEASRDGGRALWGIPKELARFEVTRSEVRGESWWSAVTDESVIATGKLRPRFGLPVRVPVRFRVVQSLSGRAKVTPVRTRTVVEVAQARNTFTVGGPLTFLAGRRAIAALTLREFDMHFGG